MSKKDGFTLIELLAVIVILAVISLIAVPQVIKIIDNAKLRAAEGSTYGLIDAAEEYVASKMFDSNSVDIINGDMVFNCDSDRCFNNIGESLNYSGATATSGSVIILNSGRDIVIDKVVFNGFVCNKGQFDSVVKCNVFEDTEKDKNPGIICGDDNTENYDTVDVCYIKSINDYEEFVKLVNSGKSFENKTVILSKDLDFSNNDVEVIGNDSMRFKGIFDGNAKKISNIKIKSELEYTGIFGYNNGTIKGLTVENVNVIGTKYVGGLVGYNSGIISDVIVNGSVTGSGDYVGGLIGYSTGSSSSCYAKNAIVRNMTVTGAGNYVGGLAGYSSNDLFGISEHVNVNGNSYVSCSNYAKASTTYCSNDSTVNGSNVTGSNIVSIENTNLVTLYAKYIDTWINGDSDSNGYYFDYGNTGLIEIKAVKENPIKNELDGSGTEEDPYLIRTVEDFNIATMKSNLVNTYYRLENNLDFNGKMFYQFGTDSKPFNGIFDGNAKTISNININSSTNDTGIFGYNNGTIKGLTVENVNVTGTKYVGGLVGYNAGIISDVIVNGNVSGTNYYVGGIIGYNSGNSGSCYAKNVIARNMTVTGTSNYVGGLAGYSSNDLFGISEHVTVEGYSYVSCSNYAKESTTYCSNDSIVNGSKITGGNSFSIENVNLIELYSNIINTTKSGDSDLNGYYFDYDTNLRQMFVKKV